MFAFSVTRRAGRLGVPSRSPERPGAMRPAGPQGLLRRRKPQRRRGAHAARSAVKAVSSDDGPVPFGRTESSPIGPITRPATCSRQRPCRQAPRRTHRRQEPPDRPTACPHRSARWDLPSIRASAPAPTQPAARPLPTIVGGLKRPCLLVGRRQVVRHRFLVPTFPGSNPGAPAKFQGFRSRFSRLDGVSPDRLPDGPHAGSTWGARINRPWRIFHICAHGRVRSSFDVACRPICVAGSVAARSYAA